MKKPVIEFENFGFKYDAQEKPTLYDISLTIYEGEKVLICGPSGCGKSTLAHCINGLIPQAYFGEKTGELKLCGKDTKDLTIFDISKMVGTVLQDSDGQFIGMTVAEDIAFALENDVVEVDEIKRRVLDAAREVDIDEHLAHAPHEISGGQKQRVSLAGVMVDDVNILLFDEPLANLDPATGKQAIELIDDISKKKNSTVVIIEHRIEDVLHRDIDRVILMGEGRIIADCSPDELLSGSLLKENGIREPLYITALKYAGVNITPEIKPAHIESVVLNEETKKRVREWFEETPEAEKKPETETALEAKDVSFSYPNGKRALNDISLVVKKGDILSIVGRNGAGKSTFSKLICGFEKQSEGAVLLNGEDMAPLSIKERADRIGYVMQNPNQMICETMIRDEVATGLRTRKVPEEEITKRVEDTLKICGLYPFRNWPVSALSFGQKKRVTIASILVINPEIIILDEPTAGQDYRHYTDIMEFLLELNRKGVTVIMITHDMHLMLEYSNRAVVFNDSRKVADDTPANILTDSGVIEQASLKETSLYGLAVRCGLKRPRAFVQRFIDCDREVRSRD